MICSVCNTENPANNRFCGHCGNPLAINCSTCGASNEPGTNFCGNCGTSLPAAQISPTPTVTAERRLVTVLFADLTGFTEFSEGRDAEEVRDFQTSYFDQSRRVIHLFGGIIEKFIGDAVMAVWGAEVATEDDAERAIRAGFELIDIVAKLSADVGAPDLGLRVGVHTGEAAVGPNDDRMGFVTGDLVNTASRLQSIAEPGTVLVGDSTQQAAHRSIAFEAVGPQSLKGKALPVAAWHATRVLSERAGRGKAESLEPPFVGRANELRLLKDLLDAVGTESKARLVSLVGEAGIGKSRLVWEFEKYIDGLVDNIYWHEGRSPAYGEGVTFWAISEMIKGRAGIAEGDDVETVAHRLDETLQTYVSDPGDRAWMRPRLAAVLGEGEAPGDRSELDAAVRAFFEAVSDLGTTVLVFEDLHWADSALIDFVEDLTDWWRDRPILIVTKARPDLLELKPSWGAGRQGVVSITLGPMSTEDMLTLVQGTVPGIPQASAEAIVERAAGMPLYAVELLRGLLAQGQLAGEAGEYRVVGDLTQLVIPESLQAVIGARLDRLGTEDKALIQDAAVLGQTFNVTGLAVLTGQEIADIERHLQSLSRRELIEPVRDARAVERGQYRFLQGLIRDVALSRLGREARRTRHLAVAEHLESQDDPELAGIVAGHYLQALEASPVGEARDAIRDRALLSMAQAASRAADLKSHQQVISISESALEIADNDETRAVFWEMATDASGRLADTEGAERNATPAIDFYRSTGDVESVTRLTLLLSVALVENNQPERALELLSPLVEDDIGTEPELVRAAVVYARGLMLSQKPGVLEAADRALAAAENLGSVPETIDALITRGTALGQVGRLSEARIIIEGAIALAEEHDLGRSISRGQNNLAYVLVGLDDAASLAVGEESYRTAQRLGDRSLLLFQVGQAAFVYANIGEFEKAEEVLANPLTRDQPPAARVYTATVELVMAAWRGDLDAVDRLEAEAEGLIGQVDDPQLGINFKTIALEAAIARGTLDEAFSLASEILEDCTWAEAADTVGDSLFIAALLGDASRFATLIPSYQRFLPRFRDHLTTCQVLAPAVDGPVDTREIDAVIANRAGWGSVADVVRFSMIAAPFAIPEKRIEYVSTARSIATERGWHGILRLIDSHLS
ncbi:MAG TPA: adenylate/guanylate cyclase domain-containing protein [Acidimicrobiia bacterium]|nr:adenylate/guanylate cyclase domain-containing protein [Acidimicrobiia bacterium]